MVDTLTVSRFVHGDDRAAWDDFVRRSRTPHFMFERAYVEYHADRFEDCSLLIRSRGRLIAVLPGSIRDRTLTSHAGLTFGGLLLDRRAIAHQIIDVLEAVVNWCREHAIDHLSYKAVPHIYHATPAEDDLYALFRLGAKPWRRDLSFAIDLCARDRPSERRRRALRAAEPGIEVVTSGDFERYIEIVASALKRHDATPVHTAEELNILQASFPDQIALHAAMLDGRMLGGVIMFETPCVGHAQYIAATPEGFKAGALDVVFDRLIRDPDRVSRWFDFGISTESDGTHLNVGLAEYKGGFGARGVVHDHYLIEVGGRDD